MTVYEFMGEHPFVTFMLACAAVQCFSYPFNLVNRWIRHRNIAVQGWPPSHLDADGEQAEKSQ